MVTFKYTPPGRTACSRGFPATIWIINFCPFLSLISDFIMFFI